MSEFYDTYTDSEDDHSPLFSLDNHIEPSPDADEQNIETNAFDDNSNQFNVNNQIEEEITNFQNTNSQLRSYQDNVDLPTKNFIENIEKVYHCLPLIFIENYEKFKMYENSKKIIAPQSLLYELSSYKDVPFPIFVKLSNCETLFGIIDYVPYIDHIYIPTKVFYNNGWEEGAPNMLTILKNIPPPATKIGLKPLDESFYDIKDVKTYLEIMFKKMILSLTIDDIIELPYLDRSIQFQIKTLEPEPVVSVHDIEEVEIDLLPMVEPTTSIVEPTIESNTDEAEIENQPMPNHTSNINRNMLRFNQSRESNQPEDNQSFVPFSGVGHKLGSK